MIRIPLLPGPEQVLKTARRARPMQLRAGPTVPRVLSSRRARGDLQVSRPAVRGITVAPPELVAVCLRVPRLAAGQGHQVAEAWELLRVGLRLPVLRLPGLVPHPQAVLRRILARERGQLSGRPPRRGRVQPRSRMFRSRMAQKPETPCGLSLLRRSGWQRRIS